MAIDNFPSKLVDLFYNETLADRNTNMSNPDSCGQTLDLLTTGEEV